MRVFRHKRVRTGLCIGRAAHSRGNAVVRMASEPFVRFPERDFLAKRVGAATAVRSVDEFAELLGLRGVHTLHAALSRSPNVRAPCGLVGFFQDTLPGISARAARLHDLFPSGLHALHAPGQLVGLTREQAATLLSCMFLDVFPRDLRVWPPEFGTLRFNDASFAHFFSEPCRPGKIASLQLVLHYFERLLACGTPRGSVYFRRLCASNEFTADVSGHFSRSAAPLLPVTVVPGRIEDAVGALQADFANEYLGGGALRGSAVQVRSAMREVHASRGPRSG